MEMTTRHGGIMSPVILGFGALDAMIAAQAAYAARDLTRKRKRRK
jgi:hypothetical protein